MDKKGHFPGIEEYVYVQPTIPSHVKGDQYTISLDEESPFVSGWSVLKIFKKGSSAFKTRGIYIIRMTEGAYEDNAVWKAKYIKGRTYRYISKSCWEAI